MAIVKVLDEGDLLHLQIDDFASFRSALGEEILCAFCRCFVHSDRLTSLAHFTRLLEEHCDHNSVATTRDLYSMGWFAVGTLREYGQAIQKLRAALRNADALDRDSLEWKCLMDVESRWESDRFYVDLRDKVAFHVDPDVVSRGLEVLATKSDVGLFFSDKPGSPTFAHGYWYRLGMEAVFEGYGIPRTDFDNLFRRVADDMMTVNKNLYELFRKILQRRGISVVSGNALPSMTTLNPTDKAERATASTWHLLWVALCAAIARRLWSLWVTIRLRLIDEELARLRDLAIRTSPVNQTDWLEGSPQLDDPRTKALLEERHRLVLRQYRYGEVEGLRLERALRRKAIRYGIATLPKQEDGEKLYTTSRITGEPRLDAEGVAKVRGEIRREKKGRREPWVEWLPWLIAIGAAAAWLWERFFATHA